MRGTKKLLCQSMYTRMYGVLYAVHYIILSQRIIQFYKAKMMPPHILYGKYIQYVHIK